MNPIIRTNLVLEAAKNTLLKNLELRRKGKA